MKMIQPTHESSRFTFLQNDDEARSLIPNKFTLPGTSRDECKRLRSCDSNLYYDSFGAEINNLFLDEDMTHHHVGSSDSTDSNYFTAEVISDAVSLSLEEQLPIHKRVYNYVASWIRATGLRVRDIGISARKQVEGVIDGILNVIKNFFDGSKLWIFKIIRSIVLKFVNEFHALANSCLNTMKGKICSCIAVILGGLGICLSKNTIGTFGRLFLLAMGALTAYYQSFVVGGTALMLVYFQSFFVSKYGFNIEIQNNVENNKAKTQGFKEDSKSLVLDLVSLSVLVSAGTTGLEMPSDAKSWDALLKRHSALHRCFSAWEFGADKIADIFDRVSRYVFKYLLGKEYTSFDHISEIENLYEQVLGLSRLDMRVNIGRDPQLAIKIQNMYLQYMNLSKVYSNNRLVMSKLNKLGGPLTDYYRQVADKNPKAHVMRKEPVCIALYAPTGTGKSYLMARMQQDLLKISGRFDENIPLEGMIYARAVEQEFWDGYAGQPVVVYDDFGQKVDSTTSPNLEFFEIIRAINIFPYQLHCAALAEKANNPFNSEFVVLTTNLNNFKPVSIISTEAFIRRIHLNVKVTLIDEVKNNGDGGQLDVEKLLSYQSENNLPMYDMSHLRFSDNDSPLMTYEDLIVKISLEYKQHHEAFSRRQESNMITAPTLLPPGAFSLTSKWKASTQGIDDIMETVRSAPRFMLKCLNDFRERVNGMYDHACVWASDLAFDLELLREHFLNRHKTLIASLGFLGLCVGGIALFCQGKILFNTLDNKAEVESAMKAQIVRKVAHVEDDKISKINAKFNAFVTLNKFMTIGAKKTDLQIIEKMYELNLISEEDYRKHKFSRSDPIREGFDSEESALAWVKDKEKKFIELNLFVTTGQEKSEIEIKEKMLELGLISQKKFNYHTKQSSTESATKVIVKPPRAIVERKDIHDLKSIFSFESGRSYDDSTRKRVNLEGIRCEQLETIKAIARRNLWLMSCEVDDSYYDIGFLTVLKGRKALLNFHYLQSLAHRWEKKTSDNFVLKFTQPNMQGGHVMGLEDFVSSAKPVYRGQHQTEFYMVDMPKTINLGRDLTHHMITPDQAGKLMKGLPLQLSTLRKDDFGFWTPMCVAGPLERVALVEVSDDYDPSVSHVYLESVYYGAPTKGGDCGNPIFIDSNEFGKKLLGFHFAGQPGKGIASVVTYNDVKHLLEDEMSLSDPQGINLQSEDGKFPLKNSSFYVQGMATETISHPCKTSLLPSLVQGVFGEPETLPAQLAPPLTPEGPMIKAILKNASDVKELGDTSMLQEIKSDYFKSNISPYFPTELELSTLDFETACKGVEGNLYMPPIKRGKSAGYPYMATASKGKTDYFGSAEWDFSSDKCKQLKTDVAILLNRAAKGEVPEAVFVATLKDEKRSVEKVKMGKTRVFSACPQHFLIAFRMYFAGFICFMTRNRIGNESAIGTNAHGYDWKEIVRNLTPWGEQNIAAGDFADFDGTFHPQMFSLVCDIINSFYNDSTRNQQIRRSLWAALVNPLHLMGGWIFSFSHGQPSGSPITALSNSIYVSLCVRKILFKMLKSRNMSFRNHVRVIAYGDDSLISVSPVLAKMLSPYDIANLFKSELGMNYTTAKKDLFSPDDGYETIAEVSFLKREFVYDNKTSHWFAPLELKSIREMCNWIRKSPSDHEATMNNCNDALKELCHHSKQTFDEYRVQIGEACRENGIVLDVPDWASVRYAMSQGQIDYISEDRPFV